MIKKWLRALSGAASPSPVRTIANKLNLEVLEDRCVLTGLSVQTYAPSLLPTVLTKSLSGSGVKIYNPVFTGSALAAGTFTGGSTTVGLSSGIVLDTNALSSIPGHLTTAGGIPNGSSLGAAGDLDLDNYMNSNLNYFSTLQTTPTLITDNSISSDASVLTFQFVSQGPIVTLKFVFATNEFQLGGGPIVQKPYNINVIPFQDTFAAFVYPGGSATNEALINGADPITPVDILDDGVLRNNDPTYSGGTSSLSIRFTALSTVLTLSTAVVPGQVNTLSLVIADVGLAPIPSDGVEILPYGNFGGKGAAVFIQAQSFAASPTLAAYFPTRYIYNPSNGSYDGYMTILNTGTATLYATFTDNGTGFTGISGMAFTSLPKGVTGFNPTQTTSAITGQTYIPLSTSLGPGQKVYIPVEFFDPLREALPTYSSGQTLDVQYF
jgi:hypothetical protein